MFEILLNWVHIMCVVVWVGGTIYLEVVVKPSLLKMGPQVLGPAIGSMAAKFTPIIWFCVLSLVITGFFKLPSLEWDASLLDSKYGMLLVVKLVLVLTVIIIGIKTTMFGIKMSKGEVKDMVAAQKKITFLSIFNTVAAIIIIFISSSLHNV